MSEFIANNSMTFKFENPAHSGTVTITTPASTKVKAGGVGVHKDNMAIVISNGSDGSITNATGSGVINATAQKAKADGVLVLREGDKNNIPIVMTGTNPSPPPPTSTYTTVVVIDDPGQDKVKAG